LVRVHGEIRTTRRISSAHIIKRPSSWPYSVLTDAQKHRFEEELELDSASESKGCEFPRQHFNQRGAVVRYFARSIRDQSFEELGLPAVVKDLCNKPRGLILVTGPTVQANQQLGLP